MLLSELFRRLSVGELCNLTWANDSYGTIKVEKQASVVLYANNALDRLHSRFVLRELETELVVVEGQKLYPLGADVIKILKVTDANGVPFSLNAEDDELSLFTPSPNVIKIPYRLKEQTLHVEYQAGPENLEGVDLDQDIDLPEVLEPALTAYIAYEVYDAMNGKEHQAIAIKHKTKFEELCFEVENRDMLSNSRTGIASRFAKNGWV